MAIPPEDRHAARHSGLPCAAVFHKAQGEKPGESPYLPPNPVPPVPDSLYGAIRLALIQPGLIP